MTTNIQKEYRILIVDDNPSIFEDFSAILTPRQSNSNNLSQLSKNLFGEDPSPSTPDADGFTPTYLLDYAANEIEASEMVIKSKRNNAPYSLVFMDSRMTPGLDGVQATRKIWNIDPEIEVVLCTAYTDYTWQEIIDVIGLSDQFLILKKPFDISAVKQLASTLTHKWERKKDLDRYLDKLETHADDLSQKTREMIATNEHKNLLNPNQVEIPNISEHSNFLYQLAELKTMEFDRLRKDFDKAHLTINRVMNLIQSIGYFSDYNKAHGRSSTPVDLRGLIKSITDSYQQSFSEKGIQIAVGNKHGEVLANIDPDKFSFVVKNLINNSIHALRDSKNKEINIDIHQETDRLKIQVMDSGEGIPSTIQSEIMKPFFTTKHPGNSSGLGLTIAKSIIEYYNGNLCLEKSTEQGTAFLIELPIKA